MWGLHPRVSRSSVGRRPANEVRLAEFCFISPPTHNPSVEAADAEGDSFSPADNHFTYSTIANPPTLAHDVARDDGRLRRICCGTPCPLQRAAARANQADETAESDGGQQSSGAKVPAMEAT